MLVRGTVESDRSVSKGFKQARLVSVGPAAAALTHLPDLCPWKLSYWRPSGIGPLLQVNLLPDTSRVFRFAKCTVLLDLSYHPDLPGKTQVSCMSLPTFCLYHSQHPFHQPEAQ
jgi:hypothetical protein